MYNLGENDLNDLEKLNGDLYEVNQEFNKIIGDLKEKKVMIYKKI